MNEGIQEYLISHLQSEITKGGINIEQ